jgi:hypothetical protein
MDKKNGRPWHLRVLREGVYKAWAYNYIGCLRRWERKHAWVNMSLLLL